MPVLARPAVPGQAHATVVDAGTGGAAYADPTQGAPNRRHARGAHSAADVNQGEYREHLRSLTTAELIAEADACLAAGARLLAEVAAELAVPR